MDLLIQNATLEQITTICSRIASPSFDEMMDDSRLEEISKHINAGDSVSDAKQKWQDEIVDKAEQTLTETDGTKTITRAEIKQELGFGNPMPDVDVKTDVQKIPDKPKTDNTPHVGSEDLHLDGPPPKDTVTLDSVMKLATDVAKSGNMDFVKNMVKEFGVKKVKDLKPEQLEPAYEKLTEAVDG